MLVWILSLLFILTWWRNSDLRKEITQNAWEGFVIENPDLIQEMEGEGIFPYMVGDIINFYNYQHFINDIKNSLYYGRYLQLSTKISIFLLIEAMSLILLAYVMTVFVCFIHIIFFEETE